MVKKLALILIFAALAPLHAVAAGTRWVADYVGAEPLGSAIFSGYGPLRVHVDFVPGFEPVAGSTILVDQVSSLNFSVSGAPAFPRPWGAATGMFQLKLDEDMNATNWWVTQEVTIEPGPPRQYQSAGTYKDGADGEGIWDGALIWAGGGYTMVGRQNDVIGMWTLSQVPEISTASLLLLGLAPMLLASWARSRAIDGCHWCSV